MQRITDTGYVDGESCTTVWVALNVWSWGRCEVFRRSSSQRGRHLTPEPTSACAKCHARDLPLSPSSIEQTYWLQYYLLAICNYLPCVVSRIFMTFTKYCYTNALHHILLHFRTACDIGEHAIPHKNAVHHAVETKPLCSAISTSLRLKPGARPKQTPCLMRSACMLVATPCSCLPV